MSDYILLGHRKKIHKTEAQEFRPNTFYLPHHAVIKYLSTTTKLRVVFDGSSKTCTDVSLTKVFLKVVRRVQQELFHIILRFRTFPIDFSADIEKM